MPGFKNNFISNWLLKSDLKTLEGSEDIIKAICSDEVSQRVICTGNCQLSQYKINHNHLQDDESNLEKSLENNFSHIYSKMFGLERELNSLFAAININNNFNNINNNHESNSKLALVTLSHVNIPLIESSLILRWI